MIGLLRRSLPALVIVLAAPSLCVGQWTVPTPVELSMTSIPQVPGAAAVALFREETEEDSLHMWSYYSRVKVLTDAGKEYANVELPYRAGSSGWSIDAINGRTIHADGSIVPFTGKPYDKLVVKSNDTKINVKVFSLPAVEVGSILEYRYKLRFDDSVFVSPSWYLQTDLYTLKAHYRWKPTSAELMSDEEDVVSRIAWTPVLPAGAAVKLTTTGEQRSIDLDVQNVPAIAHETAMPPMESLSYRVLFYYTGYRTGAEYWTQTGKHWSGKRNKFIGPGSLVKSTTAATVGAGDSEEDKLRKIYAYVISLDNTVFSREHSSAEDRAQGFKDVNSTDDIIRRKRGTDDQITELFVAMARAAGLKARLMAVANREKRIFYDGFLSTNQLDDYIAVVPVNGKDMYFDPGQRYCTFGHLAWKHSGTSGLLQTDNGTELSRTPPEGYKQARTSRVADLTVDEQGVATGTVEVTYTGDPALSWRQEALTGDDTSLNKNLREYMEHLLPGGMEVRVTKVQNLTDADLPLKVSYEVKGAIGSPTGKRLLVPANLFEANSKTKFVAAKREQPVDMLYASYVQDAVRFKLPASFVAESVPSPARIGLKTWALFSTSSKAAPNANTITMYRDFVMGQTLYLPDEYSLLRDFYTQLEAKDQETLVFTRNAADAKPAPAGN